MEGDKRREEILRILKSSEKPVSGGVLSEQMEVSRQVIVQDIALLRAQNVPVMATSKGYLLQKDLEHACCRIFRVCHEDDRTFDEMCDIVDYGGKMLDVIIEHDLYGQISAGLLIGSRRDAREFARKQKMSRSESLKSLTNGIHYHTVEAPSEEVLDEIRDQLKKDGFLIEEEPVKQAEFFTHG